MAKNTDELMITSVGWPHWQFYMFGMEIMGNRSIIKYDTRVFPP
jgi:hypothetical protein